MISVGDVIPDFEGDSQLGEFSLYKFLSDSWAIILCCPGAFVPTPTTELAEAAHLESELAQRNTKVCYLVCDELEKITSWMLDVKEISEELPDFPVVSDSDVHYAVTLGIAIADEGGHPSPKTARMLYLVNPQKEVEFMQSYPVSTGYSLHEILRVIDALQAIESQPDIGLVTPANWTPGKELLCLNVPAKDEADEKEAANVHVHTVEVPSGKNYIKVIRNFC
mmetsp:Transcript_18280/g.24101  ORF Transcript_18280/g.24101 Transcript_18280/m.24101 type:complete len:223 (+) Transcript_18280:17-685(+)